MNSKANSGREPGLTAYAIAVALAALGSTMAMSDNGNHGKADKPCSDATIRGAYGFQMQGTRPTPPPLMVTSVAKRVRGH